LQPIGFIEPIGFFDFAYFPLCISSVIRCLFDGIFDWSGGGRRLLRGKQGRSGKRPFAVEINSELFEKKQG